MQFLTTIDYYSFSDYFIKMSTKLDKLNLPPAIFFLQYIRNLDVRIHFFFIHLIQKYYKD